METKNCPHCGWKMLEPIGRYCSECGWPYWHLPNTEKNVDANASGENPYQIVQLVKFGRYRDRPCLWRRLDVEGDRILLISNEVLDFKAFREREHSGEGFGSSGLHVFLNEVFAYDAFTSLEQECIDGDVFCLSAHQASFLFSDDADRVANPTAYADALAREDGLGDARCWWLSDMGEANSAQFVRHDGRIYRPGLNNELNLGVRPALWLRIGSRENGSTEC